MTVGELIEILKQHDPSLRVMGAWEGIQVDVHSVDLGESERWGRPAHEGNEPVLLLDVDA